MSTPAVSEKNAAYFQAVVPGFSQTIVVTAVAATSAPLQDNTTLVRLFATDDCFLVFGKTPVAAVPAPGTTTDKSIFLAGGIYEFAGVQKGDIISAIRINGDAKLYITEAK